MSDHHECAGLATCLEHPRWHVYKTELRGWCISPPFRADGNAPEAFPTHAEAFDFAHQEALQEIYLKGWNEEDEAFSCAAHKRSIEVLRRSIEKYGD